MAASERQSGAGTGVRVVHTADCRLRVEPGAWPFAVENAARIEAHWQRRSAECPNLFNGRIHLMVRFTCDAAGLAGSLTPIAFKDFLYWRETGEQDRSVFDTFGSALIRARDGAVLLGRQRAGNINAGLSYLPGGFIDGRDVGADGLIDIRASVLREVAEETGLRAPLVSVRPGFFVTFCGQQVSIAVEVAVDLDSDALLERVRGFLAGDPESELEDAVLVSRSADLDRLAMPAYARGLLENLFAS